MTWSNGYMSEYKLISLLEGSLIMISPKDIRNEYGDNTILIKSPSGWCKPGDDLYTVSSSWVSTAYNWRELSEFEKMLWE